MNAFLSTPQSADALGLASLLPAARDGQPLPPDKDMASDKALAFIAKSQIDRRLWERGLFPEPLAHELAYGQLDRLLLWCAARRASDLVFCPDDPCWMQVDGIWHPCSETLLSASDTRQVVNATSGRPNSASRVLTGKPMDYGYSLRIPGTGFVRRLRLRINATNTAKGVYVVARILPTDIPALKDMELDWDLARHLFPASGLVAVSGVMGSGKSTLLAAVMHQALTGGIGRQVLTLEDPVEFDFAQLSHARRQAPVAQSALGVDVEDWASGVRSLTRRKGEIVMLGECRDEDTVSAMLAVVEQGVTAYTTVHARDVPQTVTRLVNAVREERRAATACVLASSLRLLVHQRLVPCLRTPEEARAGKPRRLALREHLALDESARRLLYRTPASGMVPVLRRLVASQGRSLASDALEKLRQGRISEATYEEVAAEQEAADRDAGTFQARQARQSGQTEQRGQAACGGGTGGMSNMEGTGTAGDLDDRGDRGAEAGLPASRSNSTSFPCSCPDTGPGGPGGPGADEDLRWTQGHPPSPCPAVMPGEPGTRPPIAVAGPHAQAPQRIVQAAPSAPAARLADPQAPVAPWVDEAGWARIHSAMYGPPQAQKQGPGQVPDQAPDQALQLAPDPARRGR